MQLLEKSAVLYSLFIDDLDDLETRLLDDIKRKLIKAVSINKNDIDMIKFKEHYCITEISARKLISNVEINHFYGKKFIINNGSEEWHELDKIRNAQVQKMAGGENT